MHSACIALGQRIPIGVSGIINQYHNILLSLCNQNQPNFNNDFTSYVSHKSQLCDKGQHRLTAEKSKTIQFNNSSSSKSPLKRISSIQKGLPPTPPSPAPDFGFFTVSSTDNIKQAASEAAVIALIFTTAGSQTHVSILSAKSSL